jgi:hypothetical protein
MTVTKYTEEGQEMWKLKDDDKRALKEAALFLLVLNPETFVTNISPYPKSAVAAANARYAELEKNPKLQAVLVSVDSLASLRTAYPNYFLDTGTFLNVISKAINEEKKP